MASDDATKAASQQSIKAYVDAAAGGSTVSRTMLTPIETIDNTGAADEFDFTVPAGYDRLIIKGVIRSDVTADIDGLRLFFNSDTTETNYQSQRVYGTNNGSSFNEANSAMICTCSAASGPANAYTSIRIEIEGPDSALLKIASSFFVTAESTSNLTTGHIGLLSSITAALTQIRLRTDNHATDQLLGTLTLYGEKDEDILVP
jgi:hypothetical protein